MNNSAWLWAVAVTTAPRPQSTLKRALDSLADAGFADSLVVNDESRAGSWPTWLIALESIIRSSPDVHAYMIVQDDVVFCRKLRAYLEQTLWPSEGAALCSPYCPGAYRGKKRGWRRQNHGWGLVGALCWVIPPLSARRMLAELSGVASFNRIDAIVGRWAARAGLDCWYHTPSLAQHVGLRNSALGDNLVTDLRQAYDFIGEEAAP